MHRQRQHPNISIRIASDDDDPDLHKLAAGSGRHVKRLLAELTLEIFGHLGVLPDEFPVPNVIRPIKNDERLRSIAADIAGRPRRTLPMTKTRPTRIHFLPEERVYLQEVSARLHWSSSYVVLEAIRAALFFASFKDKLEPKDMPDIIKLYHGVLLYEDRNASDSVLLQKLNELYKIRAPVPQTGEKPAHLLKTKLKLI